MIPANEVAVLAELYDRFANALDPFSPDRDAAEQRFYLKLEELYIRHAPTVMFSEFRREAVRQCKLFLKKNR